MTNYQRMTSKQFRATLYLSVLLSALTLCRTATLQAQQPATLPTIVEIAVVGAEATSADLIKSVAAILPGTTLNSSAIRDAVLRLDGLALFDDIQFLVEEVPGGVRLYIAVKERAKLTEVTFHGNDQLSDEDLEKLIKLRPGAYISKFVAFDKKNAILRKYADKGYFLTVVEDSLTYNADSSEVALAFYITENEKIKVREVHIAGSKQMLEKDLIGAMSNRKKGFLKSSNFNRDKYQEDLEKVIAKYHENGFIDAYLLSDSTVVDTPANRIDIYLETYEGPRYYFGKASFTDNDVYTDEQLSRALTYSEFDIFDQEKYDESIFEIYSAYQERGHLNIRVLDNKTFDDSVISIDYQIIEGLPSKVHLVKIVGNLKTKDKVIRRELSVRPGQVFHRSLLMRSLRDVMALNFFTNVVPEVQNLPNGDVDIIIKVEEKQTGQLNAGAGFSARDRLVGTFGMGIPNFRGNGQAVNFNIEFGGRRNSKQISFTEPWMFGRPTLVGADIFQLNRQFISVYTEGRRGGSVRLGKRLRWPDNFFRVSASYRIEGDRFFDFSDNYIIGNTIRTTTNNFIETTIMVDSITPNNDTVQVAKDVILSDASNPQDVVVNDTVPNSLLDFNENWLTASILSLSITRDSRNLPEFATSGSRFKYTLSKAGGPLGGFWNYTKHSVEFTQFIRLYKGIALAAKMQFAGIQAPSDRTILESERLSPGGTSFFGVVRGYDDGSLTPDTLSKPLGNRTFITTRFLDSTVTTVEDTTTTELQGILRVRANYMFVTNWEISVPLSTNSIYFLAFFDAGNSWLKFNEARIGDLYPSVGIGFRLAVPGIGTIGFDFGKPLRNFERANGTFVGRGWRTHFQVGTVFR